MEDLKSSDLELCAWQARKPDDKQSVKAAVLVENLKRIISIVFKVSGS